MGAILILVSNEGLHSGVFISLLLGECHWVGYFDDTHDGRLGAAIQL